MTNDEAKEKLCPFDKQHCQGTGCMAFARSHNEVKMQNSGERTFVAMQMYAKARGRSIEDVEVSGEWLVLKAEYDCRRLAISDESVTTKRP